MSAGAFSLLKYETNDLRIAPIRAQPETAQLTLNGVINVSAGGSKTPGITLAKVSGSRRAYGLHARKVSVRFLTAPTSGGYLANGIVSLPVFSRAVWDQYSDGDEGTYLGGTVRFAGKSEERIK
jgi:hypothetical protein